MRNWRSVWRGIRAMKRHHARVNWDVRIGRCGFWCEFWTPTWHEGRGPYLTIGLGIVCIMRGY